MVTNEMILKQKRQKFHALLAKNMLLQAKPFLLESYGVKSTIDLNGDELDELIERVNVISGKKEENPARETRELRHKCLRIMADIGIDTQDWEAVNKFMLNPHVCGRMLFQLSPDELRAFRRKLYAVRDEVERRRIADIDNHLNRCKRVSLN